MTIIFFFTVVSSLAKSSAAFGFAVSLFLLVIKGVLFNLLYSVNVCNDAGN